jgi:serine/threonine protein phosphatase 1
MNDIGRLIAIGDIHGRMSKLTGLLEKIEPLTDDRLIFPGDYVDRGPDSFEVVEMIIRLRQDYPNIVTLRGNHEDLIVSFFMGNMSQNARELWQKMDGGDQTLASYRRNGSYLKDHRDFYESLPFHWETEQYFFCHAGVRPGVPLAKQKASDLLGIREPFLSSKENFGKIIVHGHEIVEQPTILPNRINIDTGAGRYGLLTAIELPSLNIWQQM